LTDALARRAWFRGIGTVIDCQRIRRAGWGEHLGGVVEIDDNAVTADDGHAVTYGAQRTDAGAAALPGVRGIALNPQRLLPVTASG
jgi:hypothetical protein